MNALLEIAASNCAVALVLAVLVAGVARFRVNPHVVHVLWLMVLVKFFTPPVWRVDFPLPEPAPESAVEEVVIAAPTLVMRPLSQSPAPLPPEAVVPAWTWREGLLAVWGIGILAFASVTVLRVLCFRWLLRKAERGPEELKELAGLLSRRMGVRRCPEILILPVRITPAVWSLFGRPRIVLPEELAREMQPDQMETILAHELAHIRRGDHLVRLLELAVTTVFWWNPIVWWVRKNLRETEEQCCDALVLEILPDAARRYAIALIETVEFLSKQSGRLPIGATAAKPTVTLKRRIEMLKHGPTNRRLTLRSLALLLALLIVPMSLAFAQKEVAPATELKTKVYRLGDLDAKKIEQDFRQQVAAKEWEKVGGPYSMRRTQTGSLVITASPAVHEQTELILQLASLEGQQAELQKQLNAKRDNVIVIQIADQRNRDGSQGEPLVIHAGRSVLLSKFQPALRSKKGNDFGLGVDPKEAIIIHADSALSSDQVLDLIKKLQAAGCQKFTLRAADHSEKELGELRIDKGKLERDDILSLSIEADISGKPFSARADLVRVWDLEAQSCKRCHDASGWKDLEVRIRPIYALRDGELIVNWELPHCPRTRLQAEHQLRNLHAEKQASEQARKSLEAWKKSNETKPADDATFLRRIHLDLLGTLPSQKEIEEFVKDKSPNKRRTKVEGLLKRMPADSGSAKSSSEAMQHHIDDLIRKKLGDRMTIEQLLTKPHPRQSELEENDKVNGFDSNAKY